MQEMSHFFIFLHQISPSCLPLAQLVGNPLQLLWATPFSLVIVIRSTKAARHGAALVTTRERRLDLCSLLKSVQMSMVFLGLGHRVPIIQSPQNPATHIGLTKVLLILVQMDPWSFIPCLEGEATWRRVLRSIKTRCV